MIDFRWHRSTPSPNWKVLKYNERIKSINGIEGITIRNSEGEEEDDNLSTERNDIEDNSTPPQPDTNPTLDSSATVNNTDNTNIELDGEDEI